jgi:hypothetical protein
VQACTPNCTPACGQANGCGGTCGTTDTGTPGVPSNRLPANGGTAQAFGNVVQLSWTAPDAITDVYDVEFENPATPGCGTTGAYCNTVLSTSAYVPLTNGIYTYRFRVRANNSSCGDNYGAWSPWHTFTVVGNVTGAFYDDPDHTAVLGPAGVCLPGGTDLLERGTGSGLTGIGIDGITRNGTFPSNTTYSLTLPYWNPGDNSVTLDPGVSPLGIPYECTCPEGCTYYGINSPLAGVNFYVDEVATPWFQVLDGGVAAYGSSSLAIFNPIPVQCASSPGCTPAMIATPNSSAPVVMTGGGGIDVGRQVGSQTDAIDDEGKNWLARLSAVPSRQNFAYFRRIYKFPSAGQGLKDDFEVNFNNAVKPSGASLEPLNEGLNAYYHTGDMRITSAWNVAAGESFVVLVDGSLRVEAPITVANGGFLAFVTSGDVVFDNDLGSVSVGSIAPVVEGVFIADGRIVVEPSLLKFVGAGTFVGWNGFNLGRDFEGVDNLTNPAEVFTYRPDFLLNAPEEMKTPRYEWNEVNP